MDPMQTISFVNNRPGAGKTVSAINFAHALAWRGHRVMLVDTDPKGSLTRMCGLFRPPRQGLAQVLLDGRGLDDVAVSTRELLSLVPAGEGLVEVNGLSGGKGEGLRLLESMQADPPDVDYLIIDGPSAAGLLFANAVLAADLLLIPLPARDPEVQAVERFHGLLQRFDSMRGRPAMTRAFLNQTVGTGLAARPVHESVQQGLKELLLEAVIPDADAVPDSAALGRSLIEYRPQSGVTKAFERMAAEVEALLQPADMPGAPKDVAGAVT